MELRERCDKKLATVTGIDMNAVAATTLFIVPVGNTMVVTHVVIRNASIALDTADFGFGYAAGETDVIGHAVLGAGLTAAAKYRIMHADNGAVIGAETELFKIGVDIAQGAAATMDVDVFGYLF